MIKSGDLYFGLDMITIVLGVGDHYIGKLTYRVFSVDNLGQYPACIWSAFETEVESMKKLCE